MHILQNSTCDLSPERGQKLSEVFIVTVRRSANEATLYSVAREHKDGTKHDVVRVFFFFFQIGYDTLATRFLVSAYQRFWVPGGSTLRESVI